MKTLNQLLQEGYTRKQLQTISMHNKYIRWKELEAKGLKYHKKLVLHHVDVNMKKLDYWRYIQWNFSDLELMDKVAHLKLHHTGRKCTTETKSKMRAAKLGVPKSREHRKHMSEAHKRYWMKKKVEQLKQDLNK